jgi:O-antigen/teichoic acid export membrane protein
VRDFVLKRYKRILHSENRRSLLLKRNIVYNILLQALSVVLSLVLLPISLRFVSVAQYGIWLTISSILLWFSRFDLGVGAGLKNKIGQELAVNNVRKVKEYISTAYAAIFIIMTIVALGYYMFHKYFNWISILNLQYLPIVEKKTVIATINVVFYFFLLRFILQIINSVVEAFQFLYLARLNNFLSQFLILLAIFLLSNFKNGDIFTLGVVFSLGPVVVFVFSSLWFFSRKAPQYAPSFFLIKKSLIRPIFSLSLKFFIVQVNMLVLFQTSNILILRLYGSEDVVKYNIAFNLFSVINLAFSTVAAPYWSAYINAYALRDFNWIKHSINQLQKLWFLIVGAAFVLLIFSDWIYLIWIGKDLHIPFLLSSVVFIYNAVFSYGLIYNTFINSTDKVMLQTLSLTVLSILFIPLVLFFAKILEIGVITIPISLLIVSLYTVFIAPYQYKLIISDRAYGIFLK